MLAAEQLALEQGEPLLEQTSIWELAVRGQMVDDLRQQLRQTA
jgi:hypothetical protein